MLTYDECIDRIFTGDARDILKRIPDGIVNTVVTSPPYFGLRDYGVASQIGLEQTPDEYIQNLVEVFREIKRVLRDDGTVWLNLGDSYAGSGKGQFQSGERDPKKKKTNGMKLDVVTADIMGLKPKDLIGIPWRAAFALQADGWWLRQDIIWHKPNPMPESVTDRCTKAHEYIFLLSKSQKYYFDHDAILEPATGYDNRKDSMLKSSKKYVGDLVPGQSAQSFHGRQHPRWRYKNLEAKGQPLHTMHVNRLVGDEYMSPVRNKRSVWTVTLKPYKEAHFATYPPDLIEPCILAGCPPNGLVLDPFMGSGTTAMVAKMHGRHYVGTELNPEYIPLIEKRVKSVMTVMPETVETQSEFFEVDPKDT